MGLPFLQLRISNPEDLVVEYGLRHRQGEALTVLRPCPEAFPAVHQRGGNSQLSLKFVQSQQSTSPVFGISPSPTTRIG